jgi:hypothetical protein
LVPHIKGRRCAEDVSNQAGEEGEERNRSLEKLTQLVRVVLCFVTLASCCFSEWAGVGKVACKILVGTPEAERPLGNWVYW